MTYGNGLFVAVVVAGTGNRVMTSPDGTTWTLCAAAGDNQWQSVAYGNGIFAAVANSGSGDRVMISGNAQTEPQDEAAWTVIPQGLPLPVSGRCEDLEGADAIAAYGTGATGGWAKSWEPWVDSSLDAAGNRKGGWACRRNLINNGASRVTGS